MPKYKLAENDDALAASIKVDDDGDLVLRINGQNILFLSGDGELELFSGIDEDGIEKDEEGRILLASDDRQAIANAWLAENELKAVPR